MQARPFYGEVHVNVWIALGAAVVGYLFGAVSFTRVVGRWILPGDDLSGIEVAIGEATLRYDRTSASLVSMKKGPGYGCLVSVLDMAKAALPVLVFKLAFPGQGYEFFAAATAVVGHNYPVFSSMKGGAGMSPYLGGLAVLDWIAVPALTVLGSLTGLAFRNVVIAYVSGVIWLIPWFWWRDAGWPALVFAAVVNLAVWTAVWPVMTDLIRMQGSGEINTKEAMKLLTSGHPAMRRDDYVVGERIIEGDDETG
jgi:glycerol-3-phosphate acyltransferase PlsY